MIIFNKNEQQQRDLSFILTSSTREGDVKQQSSSENNIKGKNSQQFQVSNLNQSKVLSELNKKFLINLGFKLKKTVLN